MDPSPSAIVAPHQPGGNQTGSTFRGGILTGIRTLARDTRLYTFDLDAPLPFAAGQFVNLTIPGASPRPERSYSVWSDPIDPSRLEFAIKLFPGGQASEYLRDAPLGTRFTLGGPHGHFGLRDQETDDEVTWMIATSTGLAPFHSMLSVAARTGDRRRFRLLFGCRDVGDVFALARLDALCGQLDLEYTVCLSQPAVDPPAAPFRFRAGRVTAFLPAVVVTDRYYLCGNGGMIADTRTQLKAAGADRKRIHFEKYW